MRGLASTCAALVLVTSASGCALIDGLSGDGGDDDLPVCTSQEVVRGFNFKASEVVTAVRAFNTITHPSPWQISGEVRHGDLSASLGFEGEGSTLADVSTTFEGADALGDWIVVLQDTEPGEEGTWDALTLDICTTACSTGEDLAPLPLPDCVPAVGGELPSR